MPRLCRDPPSHGDCGLGRRDGKHQRLERSRGIRADRVARRVAGETNSSSAVDHSFEPAMRVCYRIPVRAIPGFSPTSRRQIAGENLGQADRVSLNGGRKLLTGSSRSEIEDFGLGATIILTVRRLQRRRIHRGPPRAGGVDGDHDRACRRGSARDGRHGPAQAHEEDRSDHCF